MPSYTMRHKETGEEKEMILSFDEREKFLDENPDWAQKLTTPGFVSARHTTLRQAGNEWNDLLKKVKGGSGRRNTIKT